MKQQNQIFPEWFAKCLKVAFAFGCLALFLRFYIIWIQNSDTFRVQKIEVEGNELIPAEELATDGGVERNINIWSLDLVDVTQQMKEHVYVSDVHIQRKLPNEIKVEVEEKNPVALLNYKGKLYCLDPEGLVLPSAPNKVYDLPVISGKFQGSVNLGQYVSGSSIGEGLRFINTILADRSELYTHISEVNIREEKGLQIYLSHTGIPVSVGYQHYKLKIRSLEAVLRDLTAENDLKRVKYINLQYRGQVVVGMRT